MTNVRTRKINDYGSPLYRFYTLRSRNISSKQRALLLTTAFYLCELDVLQDRIQEGLEKVFSKDKPKTNYWYDWFALTTDVHSYVVAWTNLDKNLNRLVAELKETSIQNIYRKREKWFKNMRSARNHIEHIDERAIKSPEIRFTPNIIKVTGRTTAFIYGHKIDIGKNGVKKTESISKEIQKWLLTQITEEELETYNAIYK
jgi:hypothetical protein